MKITVINGTEKHGVTYRLKELFLEPFREKAEITEFYLPKDCPNFCKGCVSCILNGEQTCKDAVCIKAIDDSLLEADLIVMTSPAYVMHVTGAMKNLLDHFAYRWMPHRPAPEMFGKRAVIITQCLGAGAGSAAKDIRDSLSWWGISQIGVCKAALGNIFWDQLPEKKRDSLTRNVQKLARRFAHMDYTRPAPTNLITKVKFFFCRKLQQSLHGADPEYLDGKYWAERGWLGSARPRKCLGWKTPYEVFYDTVLHLT